MLCLKELYLQSTSQFLTEKMLLVSIETYKCCRKNEDHEVKENNPMLDSRWNVSSHPHLKKSDSAVVSSSSKNHKLLSSYWKVKVQKLLRARSLIIYLKFFSFTEDFLRISSVLYELELKHSNTSEYSELLHIFLKTSLKLFLSMSPRFPFQPPELTSELVFWVLTNETPIGTSWS